MSSAYLKMTSSGERLEKAVLLLAIVLALFLVFYGAAGVRGTDQYWYVADVETLSRGLAPVTNNIFPGPMLRNGAVPENNYFMHNSPVMYVIGSLSKVIPPYNAWIIVNTLCHFIVALCIFLVLLRLTTQPLSILITSFYVLSPIAIWQTINPLLEMYYAALAGMQIAFFIYRDRWFCRLMLSGLLLLGVLSHPIFLVPAILWGIWSVVEFSEWRDPGKLLVWVCYFGLLALFKMNKDIWFPSSFQPELKAIVASVVPGKSNMFWHYSEVLPEITKNLMLAKAQSAVEKHLLVPRFTPLYLFTNLAILTAAFLSFFYMKKWWKLLIPLGVFGSQYIAMLLLQQNHPRFQQIIAVVTFTLLGVGLYELQNRFNVTKKQLAGAGIVGLISLFGLSLAMAHSGRQQSLTQEMNVSEMLELVSDIPENASIVGIDVKPHNPFSYIVRPRDMLFIRTDMLETPQIERAIELFQPDYYIVRERTEYIVNG